MSKIDCSIYMKSISLCSRLDLAWTAKHIMISKKKKERMHYGTMGKKHGSSREDIVVATTHMVCVC